MMMLFGLDRLTLRTLATKARHRERVRVMKGERWSAERSFRRRVYRRKSF